MAVTRWVLYVDESGAIPSERHKDKRRTPDECNVTGVLVDRDRGQQIAESLQKQYRMLFPWAPWPFHHTEFKQPLHHVAWLSCFLQTHDTSSGPAFSKAADAVVREIAEELERELTADWEHFVRQSMASKRVDRPVWHRVSAHVNKARWTRGALHQLRTALECREMALDKVTITIMDGHTLYGFSTGETNRGDAYDAALMEASAWGRDAIGPWGQMFMSLIDRLAFFLLTQEGEHHVDVVCANRKLWSGNGERSQFMTRRYLQRFFERIFEDPTEYTVVDDTNTTRAKFSVRPPVDFGRDANVFLMLADRLAHVMREATKNVARLSQVQQRVKADTRSVQFAHVAKNHAFSGVSAVGAAEVYLSQLWHNPSEEPSVQPSSRRQWAYTQAEQMAIASRALELKWRL